MLVVLTARHKTCAGPVQLSGSRLKRLGFKQDSPGRHVSDSTKEVGMMLNVNRQAEEHVMALSSQSSSSLT